MLLPINSEAANEEVFIVNKLFVYEKPGSVVWNTSSDELRNIYMQQFEKITTYENHQVYGLWCFENLQTILKNLQTQIFVGCNDNWETPTFPCRVFHSFSVGHRYIQDSIWTN